VLVIRTIIFVAVTAVACQQRLGMQ